MARKLIGAVSEPALEETTVVSSLCQTPSARGGGRGVLTTDCTHDRCVEVALVAKDLLCGD